MAQIDDQELEGILLSLEQAQRFINDPEGESPNSKAYNENLAKSIRVVHNAMRGIRSKQSKTVNRSYTAKDMLFTEAGAVIKSYMEVGSQEEPTAEIYVNSHTWNALNSNFPEFKDTNGFFVFTRENCPEMGDNLFCNMLIGGIASYFNADATRFHVIVILG